MNERKHKEGASAVMATDQEGASSRTRRAFGLESFGTNLLPGLVVKSSNDGLSSSEIRSSELHLQYTSQSCGFVCM